MSSITERLGPKHVNTSPCMVPRSEHAVGTAIRGCLLVPLKIEIHVHYLSAQLSPIDIRVIDSVGNPHNSSQADQRLFIDFVSAHQIGVVAEITKEPAEFPKCFGRAVETTVE